MREGVIALGQIPIIRFGEFSEISMRPFLGVLSPLAAFVSKQTAT